MPGAVRDYLIISPQAVNRPTLSGTVLCAHPWPGSSVLVNTSPGSPFAVEIPDDCHLIGLELCAQGASSGPGGVVTYANALDVRIGTH